MKLRVPVLLLALGVVVVPAPAQAAGCSGTSGVTVVVQYKDEAPEVRCAPGDPGDGFDALRRAGFEPTLIQSGGGAGALCRIDGRPSTANCGSAPLTIPYWTYFQVENGKWDYAETGGDSYNPKPGSVEGWRYGSGAAPDETPQPYSPPKATPKPSPTASPTSRPSGRSTTSAAEGTSAGPASGATASGTPTGTGTPVATTSATGTTSPSAAPSAGSTDDVEPGTAAEPVQQSTDEQTGSSGGLSWIWGVVLVALLAGAAGVTVLIRRRA